MVQPWASESFVLRPLLTHLSRNKDSPHSSDRCPDSLLLKVASIVPKNTVHALSILVLSHQTDPRWAIGMSISYTRIDSLIIGFSLRRFNLLDVNTQRQFCFVVFNEEDRLTEFPTPHAEISPFRNHNLCNSTVLLGRIDVQAFGLAGSR